MPQRSVRHLRLTAPSRDQARALLPRLEDALRCASLPDDGARLLVVRHLALGSLRHDIDAGALSRLVEQRVQAAALRWVQADTPAAASADGVVFASALAARSALAGRLLRGDPAQDWYWSPAVPEAPAGLPRRDRLRAMGQAIAGWPEARVAWPAWAGGLLNEHGGAALAALWSPEEGAALLRLAGLPLPADQRDAGARHATRAPVDRRGADGAAEPRAAPRSSDGWPAWLQHLLAAVPGPPPLTGRRTAPLRARQAGTSAALADAPPGDDGLDPSPDATSGGPPGAASRDAGLRRQPLPPPTPGRRVGLGQAEGPDQVAQTAHGATWSRPADVRVLSAGLSPSTGPADEPTVAGGLLFLLPLLARLGLPGWRSGLDDTPTFVASVLGLALQRLQIPADDPAWTLATNSAVSAAPSPSPGPRLSRCAAAAPVGWQDPRLAPPRLAAGLMAWRLGDAACGAAQAALWLDASRHWLRRIGHLGLASLVRRPGTLALTPTHADVFFKLEQTDLRVRRLGLDVDPQWLPWFGRVVAFHYRPLPRWRN